MHTCTFGNPYCINAFMVKNMIMIMVGHLYFVDRIDPQKGALRSLAVRDILYHEQIHKSSKQKEFTTHVYVPIKDFFVILSIFLLG